MGRVYKARDLDLGEMVAIKTLLTPAEGSAAGDDEERLLRELQICRRVSHPNVVRVFDLGRFDGGIFITMELLEGQILEELIVTGSSRSPWSASASSSPRSPPASRRPTRWGSSIATSSPATSW